MFEDLIRSRIIEALDIPPLIIEVCGTESINKIFFRNAFLFDKPAFNAIYDKAQHMLVDILRL